jgi:hypothetical protein
MYCTVGDNPTGVFDVDVWIPGVGNTNPSRTDGQRFGYFPIVEAIDPSDSSSSFEVSTGGGMRMKLHGRGLKGWHVDSNARAPFNEVLSGT